MLYKNILDQLSAKETICRDTGVYLNDRGKKLLSWLRRRYAKTENDNATNSEGADRRGAERSV